MPNERLVAYLIPLVGDKKEVRIADIGSGPIPRIGQNLEGVKVTVYSSDKQDFTEVWKKYNIDPPPLIEYQDMEKLTYPDEFFDIVHCENALDHTRNAQAAVKELIRVCKTSGWVYIDCNLNQKDTGYKHYLNTKKNRTMVQVVICKLCMDLVDIYFNLKEGEIK